MRLAHTFICWVNFHSTILYCEPGSPGEHKATGFAGLTAKSPWDPSVSVPSAEFTGMCCHHGFLCESWGLKLRFSWLLSKCFTNQTAFLSKRELVLYGHFTKRQKGIWGSSTYNRTSRCWDTPGIIAQALLFSGTILNTSLSSSYLLFHSSHTQVVALKNIISCTRKHMDNAKITQQGNFLLQKKVYAMIRTGLPSLYDQNDFCLFVPNTWNWLFLFGWGLTSQSTPDCLHWKMIQSGTWRGRNMRSRHMAIEAKPKLLPQLFYYLRGSVEVPILTSQDETVKGAISPWVDGQVLCTMHYKLCWVLLIAGNIQQGRW